LVEQPTELVDVDRLDQVMIEPGLDRVLVRASRPAQMVRRRYGRLRRSLSGPDVRSTT